MESGKKATDFYLFLLSAESRSLAAPAYRRQARDDNNCPLLTKLLKLKTLN